MGHQRAEDNDGDFLTPAANEQRFMVALMAYPEFRQMYMRRLRTLIDTNLTGTIMEARYDSIAADYLAEAELDRSIWGGYSIPAKRSRFMTGLTDRRAIFAANQGADGSGLIPPAASGATPVRINEIMYAPRRRRIRSSLSSSTRHRLVDRSIGLTISDGVTVTLPAGTVILPQHYAVVVSSDSDFRSTYGATSSWSPSMTVGRTRRDNHPVLRQWDGDRLADVDRLRLRGPQRPPAKAVRLVRLSTVAANEQSSQLARVPGPVARRVPPTTASHHRRRRATPHARLAATASTSSSASPTSPGTRSPSTESSTATAHTGEPEFDGQQTGTFTDTDRPHDQLHPRPTRRPGRCANRVRDGVAPPPPPGNAACLISRDGVNIVVSFSNLTWNSFIVNRIVNGNGPYRRARIDGQQTGTFTDTDRAWHDQLHPRPTRRPGR
ncbi:MAG: hypothetical protein R2706_02825 [Acidimicrobiales bacterium]